MKKFNTTHIEFVFIDESGDLGKFGSKYFTIVALSTHKPNELRRIIKKLRQRRLRKKLKQLPEIKANNSNHTIRTYVLEKILSCECSISAIVIPKTKIKDDSFKNKEKLYNYLCGILFEHINLNTDKVEIIIDKKHGNRLLRDDFNQYIESKIKFKNEKLIVSIEHLESHASSELQVVDFIAWAVNRKFAYNDSSYYDIIKHKIKNMGSEEIKNN